jgi:hypothetical protein
MAQEILYKECPACTLAPVMWQNGGLYRCPQCGLALKEHKRFGFFGKGQLVIVDFGSKRSLLAERGLKEIALSPDSMKIAIGNIYTEAELAEIVNGKVDTINPVKMVLAQIILEQLNEECYIHVPGLRRGRGPALVERSWYYPEQKIPQQGLEWQDEGNLFCTSQRLVLPSDRFTFIRLDRKVQAVQAYLDGLALQRRGEDYATYFLGGYPHEAALVAAYTMARVPALRPVSQVEQK